MVDRRRTGFAAGAAAAAVLLGGWLALAAGGGEPRPQPEKPRDASRCVEPAEWMRAHHHELLDGWRDSVVREGIRKYTDSGGEVRAMSLTGTCLGCHGTRAGFCGRCHDWAGVREGCWDCHVDSR